MNRISMGVIALIAMLSAFLWLSLSAPRDVVDTTQTSSVPVAQHDHDHYPVTDTVKVAEVLDQGETVKTKHSDVIYYEDNVKQAQIFFENGFGEHQKCPEDITITDDNGAIFGVSSCPEVDKRNYSEPQLSAMKRLVGENQPHAERAALALAYTNFDGGKNSEGFKYLRDYTQRTGFVGELYRAQVEYVGSSLNDQRQVLFNQQVLVASKYPGFQKKMIGHQKNNLLSLGATTEQLEQWSEEAEEAILHLQSRGGMGSVSALPVRVGGAS